jgi:octaprenyl-diphosphate synthase
MALEAAPQSEPTLLGRLSGISARSGLEELSRRLHDTGALAASDLLGVEQALQALGSDGTAVTASATHLLALTGKRLRPLCVALAARMGRGFGPAARSLAVAVELVHAATLLHDDVVDVGDVRRGAPAARVIWGNAASIFAGDWLLVEALRRVERSGVPGASSRLLAVIEQMILAESLQLDRRGRLDTDRAVYWRVVEGKTASLFRWALFAGARVGGLTRGATESLEAFGLHLGAAFQVADDVLDFCGSEEHTGKRLFADVREGKMTLPLLIALERDAALRAPLEAFLALPSGETAPEAMLARIGEAVNDTGALDSARGLARERVDAALAALDGVPPTPARQILAAVAEAAISRDS